MANERRLVIDCDGALVYTHKLFEGRKPLPGVEIYERDGLSFQVVTRPSARDFLERLWEAGFTPEVMTAGLSRFQTLVLNIAELGELVDQVWGADTMCRLSPIDDFLLVDDQHHGTVGVIDKLSCLSGRSTTGMSEAELNEFLLRHYMRCTEFRGSDDPVPLTELVQPILSRFGITSSLD
jgi:hypothetical protein